MLLAKSCENGDGHVDLTGLRRLGGFDQAIRHAAHGGHHGSSPGVPARGFVEDLRGALNAPGITHRSPSKLHHLHWFLHFLRVGRNAI